MSVRICPRCSTLIESGSAIFCYNCGQELEHFSPSSIQARVPPEFLVKSLKSSKGSKRFVFFLIVVPALLMILIFSLVYLRARPVFYAPIPASPLVNEFESTISALPISPFNFGKYNFASLVPADADLYLESYNQKLFLEKLLESKTLKDVQDQVGLNLEETTSFFEPEFAYVESSSSAALIGVAKDLEFLKSRSAKISDPRVKWLAADPFFVIANSSAFLKEIENTSQAKSLSLSSLAKFRESLKNLPPQGQILIYTTTSAQKLSAFQIFFGHNLDAVLSLLKGQSFVVTAMKGSVLVKGLNSD